MRFSIGYQLPDEDDSTVEIAKDFRAHISEVYFAMPGDPSGRAPLAYSDGTVNIEEKEYFYHEIDQLHQMGIKLVLLLNASCYGPYARSQQLKNYTCKLVRQLRENYDLSVLTTTSPFIAKGIKRSFGEEVEIRASVNMRIGSIKGMSYLADWFDGFYMQREFNRDFSRIRKLRQWCNHHGKSLHLLANSGCLNFCSWQTFHDNLVAHEKEMSEIPNVRSQYPSPCWEFMSHPENWVTFLQNSWIRPEDIKHYEPYFETIKLATRMHARPRSVVAAYAEGRFLGNLLELMEPSYAPLWAGYIIDNSRFPDDWFERTTKCHKDCEDCQYCRRVLRDILVNVSGLAQSEFKQRSKSSPTYLGDMTGNT